ncbi:hypothetical protein [Sphingobacterium sp.]|uniref:hypothetical protein n=1 Tax=Sphingobacterium sp. TaxID=341027 RepID=UPI002896876E|nr:hypothetical protein [Sphingobacterium sp.]
MVRGFQTISQAFNSAVGAESEKHSKKGVFTQDRDECILYRYYYYCQIKQIRLDTALSYLEKEFFIGSTTIASRIVANSDKLKEIIGKKIDTKLLRKKYPHLNWN